MLAGHRVTKLMSPKVSVTHAIPMVTVIVQVFGAAKKTNATNFVAQILHLMEEEASVSFLRRLKTCFVFPDAEDCAQVKTKGIICRLPQPSYGATGRTKHMLFFLLDLSIYRIP